VPFMELEDFDILDNGTLFGGSLAACDFDSLMAYTYTALPGGGYAGPYLLQQWVVDGQSHTANFDSIEELVSLMNQWDPVGNWTLNTTTQTITGGVPGRAYGDLVIRQISTGGIAVLTYGDGSRLLQWGHHPRRYRGSEPDGHPLHRPELAAGRQYQPAKHLS